MVSQVRWWVSVSLSLAIVLSVGAAGVLGQTPATQPVGATDAPASQADEKKKATAQTHPNNPELWNVEEMMEEAVLQITRRYNLTAEQEEFTRALLVSRTRDFLDKHEKDIRQLLKESIDMRLGQRPAGLKELGDWSRRALPIYDSASKAILEGNGEWREILDDEQKKVHDTDMQQMQSNFQQLSVLLKNWEAGRGPAFAASPPPAESGGSTQTVSRVSDPAAPVRHVKTEDHWLAYVNKFIEAYRLDEKQQNAARAGIHAEILKKATDYRERYKMDFGRIQAEIDSPTEKTRLLDLAERKGKMELPLRRLFVEMHDRLQSLPREDQFAQANVALKHELTVMYRRLADDDSDRQSRSGVPVGAADESKPAKTDKPKPVNTDETDEPKPTKIDKPGASAEKPRAEPKPSASTRPAPSPKGAAPAKSAG